MIKKGRWHSLFGYAVLLIGMASAAHASEANPLKDFRWENRVVVAQLDEASLTEFEAELERQMGKLKEYRLVVIAITNEEIKVYGSGEKQVSNEGLKVALVEQLTGMDVALIGLDGGVKRRFTLSSFSWDNVYALIDSMPMRRVELRAQKRI
jgi:hypothetical protein